MNLYLGINCGILLKSLTEILKGTKNISKSTSLKSILYSEHIHFSSCFCFCIYGLERVDDNFICETTQNLHLGRTEYLDFINASLVTFQMALCHAKSISLTLTSVRYTAFWTSQRHNTCKKF